LVWGCLRSVESGLSSFPERSYVSLVLSGLKGAHDSRVEWSVTTVNRGVEAQPALGKPTKT